MIRTDLDELAEEARRAVPNSFTHAALDEVGRISGDLLDTALSLRASAVARGDVEGADRALEMARLGQLLARSAFKTSQRPVQTKSRQIELKVGPKSRSKNAPEIRTKSMRDVAQPGFTQIDEQRENANRAFEERVAVEHAARDEEIREAELERIRRGGETSRQRRAAEVLGYLDVVRDGYWSIRNEVDATNRSVLDGGLAVEKALQGAENGVREALAPLLEAAEDELRLATEERDRLAGR